MFVSVKVTWIFDIVFRHTFAVKKIIDCILTNEHVFNPCLNFHLKGKMAEGGVKGGFACRNYFQTNIANLDKANIYLINPSCEGVLTKPT